MSGTSNNPLTSITTAPSKKDLSSICNITHRFFNGITTPVKQPKNTSFFSKLSKAKPETEVFHQTKFNETADFTIAKVNSKNQIEYTQFTFNKNRYKEKWGGLFEEIQSFTLSLSKSATGKTNTFKSNDQITDKLNSLSTTLSQIKADSSTSSTGKLKTKIKNDLLVPLINTFTKKSKTESNNAPPKVIQSQSSHSSKEPKIKEEESKENVETNTVVNKRNDKNSLISHRLNQFNNMPIMGMGHSKSSKFKSSHHDLNTQKQNSNHKPINFQQKQEKVQQQWLSDKQNKGFISSNTHLNQLNSDKVQFGMQQNIYGIQSNIQFLEECINKHKLGNTPINNILPKLDLPSNTTLVEYMSQVVYQQNVQHLEIRVHKQLETLVNHFKNYI